MNRKAEGKEAIIRGNWFVVRRVSIFLVVSPFEVNPPFNPLQFKLQVALRCSMIKLPYSHIPTKALHSRTCEQLCKESRRIGAQNEREPEIGKNMAVRHCLVFENRGKRTGSEMTTQSHFMLSFPRLPSRQALHPPSCPSFQ